MTMLYQLKINAVLQKYQGVALQVAAVQLQVKDPHVDFQEKLLLTSVFFDLRQGNDLARFE